MKRGAVAAAIAAIAILVVWQATLQRGERSSRGAPASAIRVLRAIAKAQSEYAASIGNGAYAGSLAALATPCSGVATALLPSDLGSDPAFKFGYEIRLHVKPSAKQVSIDCNGKATYGAFYATATPTSMAKEKQPAFATDETGTVWVDANGIPPAPPFRGSVVR
jgi:hypothetical protein